MTPAKGDARPDVARSRRPRTVGGAVYLGLFVASSVGLGIIVAGSWRTGLIVLGSALVCAGLARLVIAEDRSGMLGVHHKFVDATFLLLVGAAIIGVAATIHNPSLI